MIARERTPHLCEERDGENRCRQMSVTRCTHVFKSIEYGTMVLKPCGRFLCANHTHSRGQERLCPEHAKERK